MTALIIVKRINYLSGSNIYLHVCGAETVRVQNVLLPSARLLCQHRNIIDMQINQQSNGFNGQSNVTNANMGQSNNQLMDKIKQVNNTVMAVSSKLVDRIKFRNIAEN